MGLNPLKWYPSQALDLLNVTLGHILGQALGLLRRGTCPFGQYIPALACGFSVAQGHRCRAISPDAGGGKLASHLQSKTGTLHSTGAPPPPCLSY